MIRDLTMTGGRSKTPTESFANTQKNNEFLKHINN